MEAEHRLRLTLDQAPLLLWSVDPAGVFVLVEGAAGCAPGSLADHLAVGRSALELFGGVRVIETGGGSTTGEKLLRRALAGEPCSGVVEIGEVQYDTKMVPKRGAAGEITGVIGVSTDATDRVRAHAQLLQTDRLSAVSTLAAGVAHEIDHPLTGVVRNLDFVSRLLQACRDECRTTENVHGPSMADTLQELSSALEFARQGSERVHRIVRDLDTFAQNGEEKRALVDVRSVLRPVLHLVSNEICQRARFLQDLQEVPLVEVNQARLAQVFMHLLINATQAIAPGDAARQEIGVTTCTDEAGRAIFEVRDTGAGMPENVVKRIFEPFFTTKPEALRAGLGLSICHGTVTALGGEISVRSAPGQGSVFRVAIPPAELAMRPSRRREEIAGSSMTLDAPLVARLESVRGAEAFLQMCGAPASDPARGLKDDPPSSSARKLLQSVSSPTSPSGSSTSTRPPVAKGSS